MAKSLAALGMTGVQWWFKFGREVEIRVDRFLGKEEEGDGEDECLEADVSWSGCADA